MKPSLREIKTNIYQNKKEDYPQAAMDKRQKNFQLPERNYILAAAGGQVGSDTEGVGNHALRNSTARLKG